MLKEYKYLITFKQHEGLCNILSIYNIFVINQLHKSKINKSNIVLIAMTFYLVIKFSKERVIKCFSILPCKT